MQPQPVFREIDSLRATWRYSDTILGVAPVPRRLRRAFLRADAELDDRFPKWVPRSLPISACHLNRIQCEFASPDISQHDDCGVRSNALRESARIVSGPI